MNVIKVLFFALYLCCGWVEGLEEKVVVSPQVELFTESFGSAKNPAIVLIAGASCPSLLWSEEFCNKLSSKGFFVIRYDHRDTGKSSLFDYEKCPYALEDMAKDVILILDQYGIKKAHIVGQSMGGFVGQLVAIHYPDRLYSLVSLMSSPDQRVLMAAINGEDTTIYSLPAPPKEVLLVWAEMKDSPVSTKEERIETDMKNWRMCSGNKGYDEQELRELAANMIDRTRDFKVMFNHWLAMKASPIRLKGLHCLQVPTLVIHGDSDKILPPLHGVATAVAIPKAKYLVIPDMGHVVCRYFYDALISAIVEHANAHQDERK